MSKRIHLELSQLSQLDLFELKILIYIPFTMINPSYLNFLATHAFDHLEYNINKKEKII